MFKKLSAKPSIKNKIRKILKIEKSLLFFANMCVVYLKTYSILFKSGVFSLWPHGQNGQQEISVGPRKFYDSRIYVWKTKTFNKRRKKFLCEIVSNF